MTLSARNRLEGKVVEIQVGGVMAHVVVSVGKNMIESVITKRSADEMKLKVGDAVAAVIKSTEVMLEEAWASLRFKTARRIRIMDRVVRVSLLTILTISLMVLAARAGAPFAQ